MIRRLETARRLPSKGGYFVLDIPNIYGIIYGEKMDRKLYLELMRRCAVLPRGIFGICVCVPDELRVVWKGIEYYPEAYTLEYRQDGTIAHTCRLHDLTANAVAGAPLHEVTQKIKG